jgi:hypothetical protein
MNNEFGLKELYDLTLKATFPIEMDGRVFEAGEVIARFDKIQIANFREVSSRVSARGGKNNPALVIWEDPKEIQLSFTQGVFSKKQFALLSNSKLIQRAPLEKILVPFHFSGESDELGTIQLGKENVTNVFVYNAKTFDRIQPENIDLEKGVVTIGEPYCDVDIDFQYEYCNDVSVMNVGQKLIGGFLLLEGKTRVKDDITGKTRTAILRIPRLKLVSDLSMRLGREAGPLLASFAAVGYPGIGKDKTVMEMLFLNDDIDAEM